MSHYNLCLEEIREANLSRCGRWHPGFPTDDEWTVTDWANAVAGEVGELTEVIDALLRQVVIASGKISNAAKKVRRIEGGFSEARPIRLGDLMKEIEDEGADVVLYLDLLFTYLDLDLAGAIVDKFNRTSEQQDFPERLMVH